MSRKNCFLAGLAATLMLACGMSALGGKPPNPSYLIRQLDLVDQSGVEYVYSGASDVNDPVETDGPYQAVGMVFTASHQEGFPACWTISTVGGQLQSDLKLLNQQPFSSAAPSGINQLGEIVGEETTDAGQMVGVYWADSNEATVPQPLPILSNYERSSAAGINNNGVIVGYASGTKVSTERAAVWPNATASMIVLDQFLDDNSPFLILRNARAVNDTGAILGLGWDGAVSSAYVAVRK